MRYAYYPGCSLHSTGLEYDLSTKLVASHLGIDLEEIPNWNCCGASAAHATNHLLALALPARNLALAEKRGLDVAVPCAACFNRLRAAQLAVRNSPEVAVEVNEAIGIDYQARNETYALLDIFANHFGAEAVGEKVTHPLAGLRVAGYYGCLLVRPPGIGFDDPENPQSMERLVTAIGGTPVEWYFKTECCGAGHTTTRPDIAAELLRRIYVGAADAGADCLMVACPLCFLNLDMRQRQVKEKYHLDLYLPVFYFTELIGLALGLPARELGINRHFVDAGPLLTSKLEQQPASEGVTS